MAAWDTSRWGGEGGGKGEGVYMHGGQGVGKERYGGRVRGQVGSAKASKRKKALYVERRAREKSRTGGSARLAAARDREMLVRMPPT